MAVGIDVPLASLQAIFANHLWTSVSRKAYYSRVYKNPDNDGNIVGELFVSENDYWEIMFDDAYDVICFFDPDDTIENLQPDTQPTRGCGIVFAVNTKAVYSSVTDRRVTEELYRDVLSVMQDYLPLVIETQDIVTGLNAYGDLNTDKLKQFDMQPWHTFRINTIVKFDYDCVEDAALQSGFGYQYPFPILFTG